MANSRLIYYNRTVANDTKSFFKQNFRACLTRPEIPICIRESMLKSRAPISAPLASSSRKVAELSTVGRPSHRTSCRCLK
ncbi:hypothetical protein CEXT_538181 [Caerostris extrusa]|uniref:Uncharacterized protein n=1 Tax=Caerostris extrusa TaxID=172846 RepID=A0AAV4RG52_CAEEX|nr:hypothetical protein CEXT_538181 [Caerostris extrusa]